MTPTERQRIQKRLSSDEVATLRDLRQPGVASSQTPTTAKLVRKGFARPVPTCPSLVEITDAGREVVA